MALTAAAVLLAAGAGTRFDDTTPKLLAELDGKAVIRWAIDSAVASGLPGPYVVAGAVDLTDVAQDCTLVHNDRWSDGLASSLKAAIAAAAADGHDAVVVSLADQPGISPDAWRAVAAATQTPVAVATYAISATGLTNEAGGGGVPHGSPPMTAMSARAKSRRYGHPVRLGSQVWDLLPSSGDDAGRVVMRERPELVTEVPCSTGNATDIDTAEELDRFNSPTRFG